MLNFDLNVGVENLATSVADFQMFLVCDGHGVSQLASISEANDGTLRASIDGKRYATAQSTVTKCAAGETD